MNTSPEVKDLFTALSLLQLELEPATKDTINPHFKSKYADLAEVIRVSQSLMGKHGFCIIQTISPDNVMTTILGHTSGQWIRSELKLVLQKQDMQGLGSAITYARRYARAAILGITQDDDDANDASISPTQASTRLPRVTPLTVQKASPQASGDVVKAVKAVVTEATSDSRARDLAGLFISKGWTTVQAKEYVLKAYGVLSMKDLTLEQAKAFHTVLTESVNFYVAASKLDLQHTPEPNPLSGFDAFKVSTKPGEVSSGVVDYDDVPF